LFAIAVIIASKNIMNEQKEYVLATQFLRSGTSIGANVREAEYAQSKKDFIHKLSIALKEANETDYWIDLFIDTNQYSKTELNKLKLDNIEILKLLTKIIKSSKARL